MCCPHGARCHATEFPLSPVAAIFLQWTNLGSQRSYNRLRGCFPSTGPASLFGDTPLPEVTITVLIGLKTTPMCRLRTLLHLPSHITGASQTHRSRRPPSPDLIFWPARGILPTLIKNIWTNGPMDQVLVATPSVQSITSYNQHFAPRYRSVPLSMRIIVCCRLVVLRFHT